MQALASQRPMPVAHWSSWRRLVEQTTGSGRVVTGLDAIASGELQAYKVEFCMAVVTKFVIEERGSKLVLLSDGKGSLLATVHEAVLGAHPQVCSQGTALGLQQVTVLEFDPSERSLIICPKNVAVCIPADPHEVRRGVAVYETHAAGDAAVKIEKIEPPLKKVKLEPGVAPSSRPSQPSQPPSLPQWGAVTTHSQPGRSVPAPAPPTPPPSLPPYNSSYNARTPPRPVAVTGGPISVPNLSSQPSQSLKPVPFMPPPPAATASQPQPSGGPQRRVPFTPQSQPMASRPPSQPNPTPPPLKPVPFVPSQPTAALAAPSQASAVGVALRAPSAAEVPAPAPPEPDIPLYSQVGVPFGMLPSQPPLSAATAASVLAARSAADDSQGSGPSLLVAPTLPPAPGGVSAGAGGDTKPAGGDEDDLCAGLDF